MFASKISDDSKPQHLRFPLPGVSLLYDEVATITIQERAIENIVVSFEIDFRTFRHCPVFVVAQEEIFACLVEKVAFDGLTLADALAEGGQKLLLGVPFDDHIFVWPRFPIRHRFSPWRAGYQLHDVRSALHDLLL